MNQMNIFDKKALKQLLERYIRAYYKPERLETPSIKGENFTHELFNDEDLNADQESVPAKKETKNNQFLNLYHSVKSPLLPRGKSFSELLFHLLDEKNIDEVDLYQSIGMSRTHFSKIRSNIHYQPTKETVFRLAIGMKLNLEETLQLLSAAGFSFKLSSYLDLVVRWALEQSIYNQQFIDEMLIDYQENPLFSTK